MTHEEQSSIRRQQINDYLISGQTAAAWSSENNLSINKLRYWLSKFNREDKDDPQLESFIELKQTSAKEVPVIVKIGAVSIELHYGFHAETLREVIAAIRSL